MQKTERNKQNSYFGCLQSSLQALRRFWQLAYTGECIGKLLIFWAALEQGGGGGE